MPCFYCGTRLKKSGPAMKTRDHVVPKSQGGRWTVDACLRCNAAKKDMSLEEFRQLRGGIEFFGEMRERLVNEATSWIVEGPQDVNVVHYQRLESAPIYYPPTEKRFLQPIPTTRPVYTATFDISKITSVSRTLKTSKERKAHKVHVGQENNHSNSHIPVDLVGVKFGAFTVARRLTGKWEVECICGAIDHRQTKAILNPKNTFDACEDCRRPVGKLRSDIFRETGVEVTWEDCFAHIYGSMFTNGLPQDASNAIVEGENS